MNRFIGTWVGPDEYTAEVEYTVDERGGALVVSARDPSDGETANVSEVSVSGDYLCFRALWCSTGRVADCKLQVQADGEAILTFTYTDHARLVRRAV
ncbi:hypothetical protein [Jeongeupia chitinilytica]|uniref:Lipocalin-like domain-containing protein n=1 Tax=Jeongeupia chitinilytica TaxID=1041641 RepID=A0ABQ3GXQ2_9NEIS|nr:hypothetical protein [Jeongeupia chitinilytica]GHD59711.1 hypothetical protein GCM10007350_11330 [Jeongeupia chitinilytica]